MAVDYLSALNTKGSGLNITQIVDSLVEAEIAPQQDALNKKIEEKNTAISALGELISELSALKNDLSTLEEILIESLNYQITQDIFDKVFGGEW